MTLEPQIYLLLSILVGVGQIADAIRLLRDKGVSQPNAFTLATVFSFCEYAWAAVSYFVLRAGYGSVPSWLPASFVTYVAAFFVLGIILVARSRGARPSIPKPLAVAGGVFGLYFAIASALHAVNA